MYAAARRNEPLLDLQAAARTIFGQYPGGHSMEEKHMFFSERDAQASKRRAAHHSHYGVYYSICPVSSTQTLFHATTLMLHPCVGRVANPKHAVKLFPGSLLPALLDKVKDDV